MTEVLPILYLHGLSTGDFGLALRDLLGEDASGLSSSAIQRLTEQWQAEHAAFRTRELRFHRYCYRPPGWAPERPGVTTAEAERIKELERENREPRRANEILKAASAFFGRELDPRPPKS